MSSASSIPWISEDLLGEDCCRRFEEVHIEKVDNYYNLLKEQKRLLSEGTAYEARKLDAPILRAEVEKDAALANLSRHRNSHAWYPDETGS
jgi:hypothetical protein